MALSSLKVQLKPRMKRHAWLDRLPSQELLIGIEYHCHGGDKQWKDVAQYLYS